MRMVCREEEGNECTVCQQEFVQGATAFRLPCSHTYHEHCILRWVAHSTSCPMCRLSLLAQENGADHDDDAVMMIEADDGATTHNSALDTQTECAHLHDKNDCQVFTCDEKALVLAVREAAFDFEAAAAKLSRHAHVINMSGQQCRERYSQVVARWAVA
jgi:hypothetical protein